MMLSFAAVSIRRLAQLCLANQTQHQPPLGGLCLWVARPIRALYLHTLHAKSVYSPCQLPVFLRYYIPITVGI